MDKETRCLSVGFCDINLEVHMPKENRIAGIIKFRTCYSQCWKECCKSKECCSLCKDLYFESFYCCDFLDSNKQQNYIIFLRKCYACPIDCCDYLKFTIENQSNIEVWYIDAYTSCCSCAYVQLLPLIISNCS